MGSGLKVILVFAGVFLVGSHQSHAVDSIDDRSLMDRLSPNGAAVCYSGTAIDRLGKKFSGKNMICHMAVVPESGQQPAAVLFRQGKSISRIFLSPHLDGKLFSVGNIKFDRALVASEIDLGIGRGSRSGRSLVHGPVEQNPATWLLLKELFYEDVDSNRSKSEPILTYTKMAWMAFSNEPHGKLLAFAVGGDDQVDEGNDGTMTSCQELQIRPSTECATDILSTLNMHEFEYLPELKTNQKRFLGRSRSDDSEGRTNEGADAPYYELPSDRKRIIIEKN